MTGYGVEERNDLERPGGLELAQGRHVIQARHCTATNQCDLDPAVVSAQWLAPGERPQDLCQHSRGEPEAQRLACLGHGAGVIPLAQALAREIK